jgi:hypothetical protein
MEKLWHEGTIGVPKENGGYTVVHYWAKVYDEPSRFGIEQGRISKLMLKQNGEIVYNFDRGLDVDVQTEEANVALAILLHEYK